MHVKMYVQLCELYATGYQFEPTIYQYIDISRSQQSIYKISTMPSTSAPVHTNNVVSVNKVTDCKDLLFVGL